MLKATNLATTADEVLHSLFSATPVHAEREIAVVGPKADLQVAATVQHESATLPRTLADQWSLTGAVS